MREYDKIHRKRRAGYKNEIQGLFSYPDKILPVAVLYIICHPRQQNAARRRNYSDQYALYFYRGGIISRLNVRFHKTEHYRVKVGIYGGRYGHSKKHNDHLYMLFNVISAHGPEINVLPQIYKIQDSGRGGRKNRYASVYHIIFLFMYEQKHKNKGDKLKSDRPYRYIRILLQ